MEDRSTKKFLKNQVEKATWKNNLKKLEILELQKLHVCIGWNLSADLD